MLKFSGKNSTPLFLQRFFASNCTHYLSEVSSVVFPKAFFTPYVLRFLGVRRSFQVAWCACLNWVRTHYSTHTTMHDTRRTSFFFHSVAKLRLRELDSKFFRLRSRSVNRLAFCFYLLYFFKVWQNVWFGNIYNVLFAIWCNNDIVRIASHNSSYVWFMQIMDGVKKGKYW